MLIGYMRVSTFEQNTNRQLAGLELEKVFIDKISGAKADRPQLNEMISFVREGDTVIIHSLDRLARDLMLSLEIIKKLNDKKVIVKFFKENLTFDSLSNNPMDVLILHIFGAIAQFQRAAIREAQREGIEARKKNDANKGRAKKLEQDQLNQVKNLMLKKNSDLTSFENIKYKDIAKELNISPVTLWRYRKELKSSGDISRPKQSKRKKRNH